MDQAGTSAASEPGGVPFGPYQLVGVVGRGATSTVYLAREQARGELVVLKVLDPALAALPGFAQRLEAVSAVLAGLSAPHLVATRGTGVVDGARYLATTYVDGASLRAVERAAGRLSAPQALGLVAGVAEGLAAAHAAGLVHGDVKPENILCDRTGQAWVGDVGQVVAFGGATEGATPAYMSPEAARGLPLDARSDLYSLGVVLHEALAGRRPFEGADDLAVLVQHADSPPPPPDGAGPATTALVARVLAKDPADRPQTAAGFFDELETAATADEGSDWRRRAQVSGLVATAATGVEQLASATPAGAATGSAPSATGASATNAGGGLLSSHPVLTGAVAAVVAAGVAFAGVAIGLARSGNGSTSGTPSAAGAVSLTAAQLADATLPAGTCAPTGAPITLRGGTGQSGYWSASIEGSPVDVDFGSGHTGLAAIIECSPGGSRVYTAAWVFGGTAKTVTVVFGPVPQRTYSLGSFGADFNGTQERALHAVGHSLVVSEVYAGPAGCAGGVADDCSPQPATTTWGWSSSDPTHLVVTDPRPVTATVTVATNAEDAGGSAVTGHDVRATFHPGQPVSVVCSDSSGSSGEVMLSSGLDLPAADLRTPALPDCDSA